MKCKYHDFTVSDLFSELKKISQELFSLRMQKFVQKSNVQKRYKELKLFRAQIMTVLTSKKTQNG